MESLPYMIDGFAVALQPTNLMFVFVGALLGTIIGILPGIGATAGIALLLPLTFGLEPVSALIMLCGIYYGSSYGGTAASVLINTPGDGTSVITVFDGYPMARNGRAGAALAVAAVGSFVAGTISVIALSVLAIPFASVALEFGPAENFMLMVFTMSAVSAFTGGSLAKGMFSVFFGLMIATAGIDLQSGQERFTFGFPTLQDGVPFLSIVVGFFALTEVLYQIKAWYAGELKPIKISGKLWCTPEEWRRSIGPITRGGVIGFLVGILPGAGGIIATVLSYATEKRLSKHPEMFGKGAIEGVAGPEAANNSSVSGNLVPLLTLGIPGSGVTAVLLGAFIMYGIQPGPQLMQEQPALVWGLIDSMYVGNVILLVLNLPLIGLFVRILYLPSGILMAGILVVALTGVYSVNNSITEVYLALGFAVVGYFFRKAAIPVAPLILGVVLGNLMEQAFRQGMTISGGDPLIFLSTPVCLILAAFTLFSLLAPTAQHIWSRRRPSAKSLV
ncbi:putative tricarboxylic transport membrane protein [Ancylobacter aquaticus]|uniref:Putative tricarboxylic transport membrane protein n=1 Tax=Ancylobacter aquaticus TaxID=100 RepID=A0A4R1IBG5_ANCAQ|nr:tripartite tricarboxylate transporter permease [Ancylobacter aquaticus]TCK30399.1 putative tricarboxylic transport membrane protein [Ancylobacter aquaticus]